MYKNPYIIGRPITKSKYFFGRKDIFDFINDNLINKQKIILLHGQRRIGKSSLLHQIPGHLPRDFVCFILDLQDKAQLPLSDVLYNLATEILDSLNLSSDEITLPSVRELENNPNIFSRNFLPQIYQVLGDKNIVLLLDEFDVLNNTEISAANQHFFPYLKSLITQQEKLFVIPVVGRQLEDMRKLLDLFRSAPRKEIGLLNEWNATQLICKPAEVSLEYKQDAIQAILDLSAGHPYFIQILCFAIFMRARDEERRQVTHTDVENVIEPAMEMSQAGLVWFREGLSISEQVIFSTAAELQQLKILVPKSTIKEPLELLKEYGVVKTEILQKAEEQLIQWKFLQKGKSVTIEFVRQWLVKQYSLREVISKLEKIDEKVHQRYKQANKIYAQDNIADAINLYEQVLESNPNHFSALFDLAEAYLKLKEFSKAIKLYKRAYKVEPLRHQDGLVQSRLNYGESLILQEQFILAKEQFNEILTIDSNHTTAKLRLAEVEEALHRLLTGPYVVGTHIPPAQFLGRQYELYIAFNQIFNGSNWCFFGSLGIGKTSFLKYLAAPEIWQRARNINSDNKYIFTYIDCELIDNFSSSVFWKEILIEVKEILQKQREQYQNNIGQIDSLESEIDKVLELEVIGKDNIKVILQNIKKQDKYLVLLLDNYDYILECKNDDNYTEIVSFLRDFRYLANHKLYGCIATIMTSSKPLSELGSESTYNYLPDISFPLPSFQETEVVALWNQMPEPLRRKDELRNKIHKMTGGYPALIQMMCFLLYNKFREGIVFSAQDLEGELNVYAEKIIPVIWKSMSDIERMLIRWIALYYVEGKIGQNNYDLSGIYEFLKEHEKKLNYLEKRGIIISKNQSGKKTYYLAASLMHDWVINEIIENLPEEVKDRERVFLKMNKGHVKQMNTAMQWVSQNAGSVKSIAGGIQEVVKLLVV